VAQSWSGQEKNMALTKMEINFNQNSQFGRHEEKPRNTTIANDSEMRSTLKKASVTA
jgi:hypothetical protein